MTPQEVFDTVVTHLRKQGAKAQINEAEANELQIHFTVPDVSVKYMCAYRTPSGNKCAAGCLIKDEEYSTKMEGKNFRAILYDTLSFDSPPSLIQRLDLHSELIAALQDTHDNLDVSKWETQLKYVARSFELTYTPPSAA